MRPMLSLAVTVCIAVLVASWLAVESRAQAPERSPLAGAWARNHELSDPLPTRGERGEQNGRSGRGSRGGRGGYGGGGGYGRGGGGGGGGRTAAPNPEEAERM